MSSTAIVSMTLICGVVWGGLAYLILRAVRSQRARRG